VTNTSRQPAGIPIGGQFAPTSHGEADVELVNQVDEMAQRDEQVRTVCVCDQCGDELIRLSRTDDEDRESMLDAGWSVTGSAVLCPSCERRG